MEHEREDVQQMRAAFFAKTRRTVVLLYGGLASVAIGLGAIALISDAGSGGLALGAGFGAAVLLFAISPLIPVPASAMNVIVGASVVIGVLAVSVLDLDRLSAAVVAGACAGFSAGMIVGIAAIRRRLARDDELIRRQKRLGWDL